MPRCSSHTQRSLSTLALGSSCVQLFGQSRLLPYIDGVQSAPRFSSRCRPPGVTVLRLFWRTWHVHASRTVRSILESAHLTAELVISIVGM